MFKPKISTHLAMELLPLHRNDLKTYLENVALIIKLFIRREICSFVSFLTHTPISLRCNLEPQRKMSSLLSTEEPNVWWSLRTGSEQGVEAVGGA